MTNAAASRLRGSRVFCRRDAARRSFARAASVASGDVRTAIRRIGKPPSRGPTRARTAISPGLASPGLASLELP
jgi:hypothetical protein